MAVCPQLWLIRDPHVTDVLPPRPENRTQAFELGECRAKFMATCDDSGDELPAVCLDILREAGDVLGSAPLTKKQLLFSLQLIEDLDAERSIVDCVLGSFSFVNIMWLVLVLVVFKPVVRFMHRNGILEAAAYVLAFTLSVQGSRYSTSQADAGTIVALSGGLAFLPLWGYSTALHTSGLGDPDTFTMMTSSLLAGNLIPLAILHDSRLIGFASVLALYIGLGFGDAFDGEDSASRCLVASVILGFAFITLARVTLHYGLHDITSHYIARPFATGAMVFGTFMYFFVLLIKCSDWYCDKTSEHSDSDRLRKQGLHEKPLLDIEAQYITRYQYVKYNAASNMVMLGSLIFAALVGSMHGLQSLTNTACSFAVLWVMLKVSEVNWGAAFHLIVFLHFVFLCFVANFLLMHPEYILAMFDPSGIFLFDDLHAAD